MKDACPGLKMVAVDWRRLYTDPEWLQLEGEGTG